MTEDKKVRKAIREFIQKESCYRIGSNLNPTLEHPHLSVEYRGINVNLDGYGERFSFANMYIVGKKPIYMERFTIHSRYIMSPSVDGENELFSMLSDRLNEMDRDRQTLISYGLKEEKLYEDYSLPFKEKVLHIYRNEGRIVFVIKDRSVLDPEFINPYASTTGKWMSRALLDFLEGQIVEESRVPLHEINEALPMNLRDDMVRHSPRKRIYRNHYMSI